jgi:hypothetical protein
MIVALVTLLVATATQPESYPVLRPAHAAAVPSDSAGLELLRRARERRESSAREIMQYEALARERISLGLRTLGRERLGYRRELAARIHWRRGAGGRVELLGARQVAPLFTKRTSVPEEIGSSAVDLVFDPGEDRFFDRLFGGSDSSEGADGDSWIRHPLVGGSEADYRYQVGDTTIIRLADRSEVRLIELRVVPRRNDSRLLRGSFWLEAETYAPVRGVFRLERPFDLQLDARHLDEETRADAGGVPLLVRPLVFPIRANLRLITMEYSLWSGRWWLPRRMAVDAIAEVGALGGLPFRFERSYSEYRVIGSEDEPLVIAPGGETELEECARSDRRRRDRDGSAEGGSESAEEAGATNTICRCRSGNCTLWEVVPGEVSEMLISSYLPPSPYAHGERFIDDTDARELTDRIRSLAPTTWALSRPAVSFRLADGDLVRYNRIEALSVGAAALVDVGAFSGDATIRLGVADLRPGLELGGSREGLSTRLRIAGYQRLASVDPTDSRFGLGSSLSALLLGRDDGDYFRAKGVEMLGGRTAGADPNVLVRLYAERQRAALKETDFSLPHLVDRDHVFRPALPADEADQVGAALVLATSRGLDPSGHRWSARVFVEGSTGSFTFARSSLAATSSFPLSPRLVGSLELAGGSSVGELPAQAEWLLGGARTLRGFPPASRSGESFWRSRAEVATSFPATRFIVFSDVGWAGDRDRFAGEPVSVAAGAGVSFLDGLIRFDLARGLKGGESWRFEAYLNGRI